MSTPRYRISGSCTACGGTGHAICSTCNNYRPGGNALIILPGGEKRVCPTCEGWGYDAMRSCPKCHGTRTQEFEEGPCT
jgi:DnaJ-class molecular chaperone